VIKVASQTTALTTTSRVDPVVQPQFQGGGAGGGGEEISGGRGDRTQMAAGDRLLPASLAVKCS